MKTLEEYERERFEFEGRRAELVCPEKRDAQGRWAIYTEYFGAFPGVAEALLERGWCIAHLENSSRWGRWEDQAVRMRYVDFLARTKGLSPRCVPIGMSCGGLHAVKFADYCPDRVAALYLDAPVINLLSCPMAFGRKARDEAMVRECLAALNMEEKDILSYREHPLDVMHILVKHRIPVVMVYGDADPVVPYAENGALLERAYKAAGAPFVSFCKPGCAHHPHGLADPTPIVTALEAALQPV